MDGWMDGWMGGWMDGWVGGWIDGWMDGWIDGWMDGQGHETAMVAPPRPIRGRSSCRKSCGICGGRYTSTCHCLTL